MPDTPDHNPHKHAPEAPPETPICSISEDDGRALDALLAARASGSDQGPTPPGLGERSDKLAELLGLLEHDQAPDPSADITARTMQAVANQQQRKRFADQVQALSAGGPRQTLGFDWKQLATAAAVFLIAASLLLPMMERQQADSRRVAGAGNLGSVGRAMATYATDNLGQMPRGDVKPGEVWWHVGQPQSVNSPVARSNSAHLFRLYSKGYISIEELTCPENMHAQNQLINPADMDWTSPQAVSFSYQNQYTPGLLRLEDNPTMAVLADRNPLFEVVGNQIVFNPKMSKLAPSRAHRGFGQNVLTADGVVTWRVGPLLDPVDGQDTDNIWTANGIDVYTGREAPAESGDSHLVP